MNGLTHVRWMVHDMGPMVAFYRDTLGFKVVADVPGTYVEIDTGGARVGICPATLMASVIGAPVATGPGDDVLLQIRVEDVDSAAKFLRAKGVTMVTEPHDQPTWLIRIAHVRDPCGHLIELFTPLARS